MFTTLFVHEVCCDCRLLLAPLLKHAAPGNLGLNALSGLPSRSKLALPKAPVRKQAAATPLSALPERSTARPTGIAAADDILDLTLDTSDTDDSLYKVIILFQRNS